jgi:hypothetical protein
VAAAILEIKDGVAHGPLHIPADTGPGNLKMRLADCEPLAWDTLCGVRGYVYRREGLVDFDPTLEECFECRVAALKPKKPEPTPEERRAKARSAKRRQRRSIVPPEPVICSECGSVFTPSKYARRDARRFCSRPCYYIDHWRRRRQEMVA